MMDVLCIPFKAVQSVMLIYFILFSSIASYIQCDEPGQMYTTDAPVCHTHCSDLSFPDASCTSDIVVSGCACPEGQFINEDGQCVAMENCNCYDEYKLDEGAFEAGAVSERACSTW